MVVVAIMAILAALAGPSFAPLIERWRVRDAAETLTSSLYYARSEAIKRGGNVIIIKNPNSGTCTTATGDTQWGCGWRIFFDANGNGAQDACVPANTPNECDLQVTAAPHAADAHPGKQHRQHFHRPLGHAFPHRCSGLYAGRYDLQADATRQGHHRCQRRHSLRRQERTHCAQEGLRGLLSHSQNYPHHNHDTTALPPSTLIGDCTVRNTGFYSH